MRRTLGLVGLVFLLVGIPFCILGVFLPWQTGIRLFFVFDVLGGIFTALGAVFLYTVHRKNRLRAWLLAQGTRIDAAVTDVVWDTRCSVNGRHPFVVCCEAAGPDGRVYAFESEGVWYDPRPFLAGCAHVPVCVDPENYSRYAVDLSGILPEEGELP